MMGTTIGCAAALQRILPASSTWGAASARWSPIVEDRPCVAETAHVLGTALVAQRLADPGIVLNPAN